MSQVYFLYPVLRSLAIATVLGFTACGSNEGTASTGTATVTIPAGEQLVWSDEFSAPGNTLSASNWSYETGGNGWGNDELETYCSPDSNASSDAPCDPSQPNSFVGSDGYLHIVARRNSAGQWTSARIKTQGHQSFQYGRLEARIKIPAGQGVWPAFWMMGSNISQKPWPACGEADIMENVGKLPAQINGSVHGTGFTGDSLTTIEKLSSGAAFAGDFHTYGMIWAPGKVQFYVDDSTKPYATYTKASLPSGATWPFDDGKYFFLLNLAMGGDWPGNPDASTSATNEMLVDYVRVYQTK